MSSSTNISWTQATWNPTVGCSIVSAGCTHCYAMKMAARIERMGGKAAQKYGGLTEEVNGNVVWSGVVRLDPAALPIPLKWRDPRLIFVNSMSDLFHATLSWSDIDQVFAIMSLCGQHTFQVLTKRPDGMRGYLNDPATKSRVELRAEMIRPGFKIQAWPLLNVWCGTSIEDQASADRRLPILLEARTAVRFVSIEPLIKPVVLGTAVTPDALKPGSSGLHWIIVGGESGPDAHPMHPDWARALRDEAILLGIPFFFKQHGNYAEHNPGGNRQQIGLMPNGRQVPVGAPGSVTLWNLGKKQAGDMLDGQRWQQFPPGYIAPASRPQTKGSRRRRRAPGDPLRSTRS